MVHAPFSDEQVLLLERYQEAGAFHPYTCCQHRSMQPRRAGLYCPDCGRLQTWVLRSSLMLARPLLENP
jgi:hypothetical protein